jgi:hypothetical protein
MTRKPVKLGKCNACGTTDYLRRGWCLNCYRRITGLSKPKRAEIKGYAPKSTIEVNDTLDEKVVVFIKVNKDIELKLRLPVQIELQKLNQLVGTLQRLEVNLL